MSKATYNFEGKVAVVTGAGKGIGREIAKALCRWGATTWALSRTQADLDSLREEVAASSPSSALQTHACDCADSTALSSVLEAIPKIDLLVNNAGIALLGPLLEATPEDFDKTMAVNVRGAMVATQVAGLKMKSGGGGSIVNVSSQASLVALPDHTSYCVSKAALDMLTHQTALELGPFGVRCNSVNPTVVLTDMGRANWGDEAKSRPMLNRIPLGRFAEVEDVVRPIMFLLSDDAAMITGAVLPIEGGLVKTCTLK